MNKYLIPPQTRTLFFESYFSNEHLNKWYKYNYQNDDFSKIKFNEIDELCRYKFRLNLPAMEVEECQEYENENGKKEWRLFAINDDNKKCYVPLPNIYTSGKVCIDFPYNFKHFLEMFYSHSFNFSLTSNLYEYIDMPNDDVLRHSNILLFMQKWQDEGSVNLIER